MTQALGTAVHEALEGGARAIVLAAEPPVFCAGGSLDELLEPVATLPEIYEGMLALARAPVPTIAAVGGPAIGAGREPAPVLRRDRGVAVGPVRPALARRRHPPGRWPPVPPGRPGRSPGRGRARCCSARWPTGERAADIGLAWRCVPDADLLPTAVALAERAAGRDGALVRRTKATLDASLAAGDADAALGGRARGAGVVDGPPRVHRHASSGSAASDRVGGYCLAMAASASASGSSERLAVEVDPGPLDVPVKRNGPS